MPLPFTSLRFNWSELSAQDQVKRLERPVSSATNTLRESVSIIVEDVRQNGDEALRRLTEKYDGALLESFRVSTQEIEDAQQCLSQEEKDAIARAAKQIEFFHEPQLGGEYTIQTAPGIECSRMIRPIEAVGLYAPGGTAPLPSTVLMLGIPAKLAGCPKRILCTPPSKDGSVAPAILVAAAQAGISAIYKIGGAQAIAAMAYGTQTIPKIDKLFGPGNSWVTEAKLQVSLDASGAGCDMPAGPSEVLVIADETASAEFVASDLLSQAEHGTDSQVILLATSASLIEEVQLQLGEQLETLSRNSIAQESLSKSALILVDSLDEAIAISNRYAPEHLILQTEEPRALLPNITNAGSIFIGPWSPEAVGDYASGTNHVLPTYGYAKAYSGLSIDAFQKKITVQELSPSGLLDIGPTVEILANLEGLDAHGQAVTRRLKAIKAKQLPSTEDILRLARPGVVQLKAYESARSKITDAKLFLDANENPYSPQETQEPTEGVNRYPHPQPEDLVKRLAELYKVSSDNLIVGRGSDDIIDALLRGFCEASKDSILTCPPTYGVYQVAADLQGAGIVSVPLDEKFGLDVPGIVDAWKPAVKLVFICSPNNPTGTLVPLEQIASLCSQLNNRALVVVDEAYIEFADAPSATTLLDKYSNLIVLRTLSKAWGLAGARCGVGIGNKPLIDLLQKVRAPYPLTTPSINLIRECLSEAGETRCNNVIAEINQERSFLEEALLALPEVESVIPSSANFLLVKTTDAQKIFSRAKDQGIIIRDRSTQHNLANCVRISVGTREQNESLLRALRQQGSNS